MKKVYTVKSTMVFVWEVEAESAEEAIEKGLELGEVNAIAIESPKPKATIKRSKGGK